MVVIKLNLEIFCIYMCVGMQFVCSRTKVIHQENIPVHRSLLVFKPLYYITIIHCSAPDIIIIIIIIMACKKWEQLFQLRLYILSKRQTLDKQRFDSLQKRQIVYPRANIDYSYYYHYHHYYRVSVLNSHS